MSSTIFVEKYDVHKTSIGEVHILRVLDAGKNRHYMVVFSNGETAIIYAIGRTRKEALAIASRKWKEEGRQGDPFAEVWRRIKEKGKPGVDAKALDVMTKLVELKMQLISEAISQGCTVLMGGKRRKMMRAKPIEYVGFRKTLFGVLRTRVEVAFKNGRVLSMTLGTFLETPISIVCGGGTGDGD